MVLDEGNIEYSKTVLEKVAAYSDILSRTFEETGTPEEKSICGRLTAEYFVLRTVLVCYIGTEMFLILFLTLIPS
jgi:hypothetical protein